MTTDITPTKNSGSYWVIVRLDGSELPHHGPFATIDEAEAIRARFGAICHCLHQQAAISVVTTPATGMAHKR